MPELEDDLAVWEAPVRVDPDAYEALSGPVQRCSSVPTDDELAAELRRAADGLMGLRLLSARKAAWILRWVAATLSTRKEAP